MALSQTELDTMLITAVRKGKNKGVETALKRCANIYDRSDMVPREAAENGQKEIVNLLLEHGADIHAEPALTISYSMPTY